MQMLQEYIEALLESEIGEQMPTQPTQPELKITVMVDLDGVLASFQEGVEQDLRAAKAHSEYHKVLSQFPELSELPDDALKKHLAGPQEDPGMKALKKSWNNYRNFKYMVAGKPGFFLNLPVLPGAREMLQRAAELTGSLPAILTAPIDGDTDRCAQEKQAWVQKHFSGLTSAFYCTQDKHRFAGPGAILIDDRTKYTQPFEKAGGIAILHKTPEDSMKRLEQIVNELKTGYLLPDSSSSM